MALQLRDEANVESLWFNNITMTTRHFSEAWWGAGEAVSVSAISRTAAGKVTSRRRYLTSASGPFVVSYNMRTLVMPNFECDGTWIRPLFVQSGKSSSFMSILGALLTLIYQCYVCHPSAMFNAAILWKPELRDLVLDS